MATARLPQTNSTRHPCLTFSIFRSKNASDLPRGRDMGTAASGQVEVMNINEPQLVPFRRRELPQSQVFRLFAA